MGRTSRTKVFRTIRNASRGGMGGAIHRSGTMIKVKHFLQPVEDDDGQRIWVEPFGLTRDLREWCDVEHVLPHLGPPRALWDWFEEHPDGYDYFRARYHGFLAQSKYKPALRALAQAGVRE